MFCLSIVKDTMAIHPSNFGAPVDQALIAEINKKYANRVLHDVGLCICVFDLTQAGEGKVRYGDGFLWYKVVFRLVVFRPFTSEVIVAKVKSSDEDGIRLTLGFFDDIYIPVAYLPQPSAFDPSERAHFWIPDAPSSAPPSPSAAQDNSNANSNSAPVAEKPTAATLLDTPVASRMYIDRDEPLRVRVEGVVFVDDEPGPPRGEAGASSGEVKSSKPKRAPYEVWCSIAEQGLGPIAWWSGGAQEDDGDGDDEMMGDEG